jgi:fructose-1,6-bisphosphatase/inositol monophosphatase family enzyme
VLGEEACAANPALMNGLDRGQVWIVDPLDGTANFVAGLECFGIIVALARDGVTEMAWLFDPVNDRMSHAARGGGAYVDGRQIPLGEEQPARPIAALATQFMNDSSRESLLRRAEAAYDVRPIPRCAAEHYPRLALRENHVALFQRTLPWDHAAGALFLTEAGGKVSRWDGSPYCFHDDRLGIVAASSPALWQAAMTTLIGDGLNPAPHRHRVSRSTS